MLSDASAPKSVFPFPGARLLAWVVGLLTFALGLVFLADAKSDLPAIRDFLREAREVYLPAESGHAAAAVSPFIAHNPGRQAWSLFWLGQGGQWDHRVLALGSLLLQALAAGVLFYGLTKVVRRLHWLALAGGFFVVLGFAPLGLRPAATATDGALLLLLFALQWHGLNRAPDDRRQQVFSAAAGLFGLAWASAGLAAPVALLLWTLLDRTRRQRFTLIANAVLVVLGLGLLILRSGHATDGVDFLPALAQLLALPFLPAYAALLVWAPSVASLIVALRARSTSGVSWWLPVFALWLLLSAMIAAGTGLALEDFSREWLAASLLVNAACLLTLGGSSPAWHFSRVALWAIVVGNALFFPAEKLVRPWAGPIADEPLGLAMGEAAAGRPAALQASAELSPTDRNALATLLADPQLRRILPASIRPPLDGVLPPPVSEVTATGTWVSAPLSTTASLLQFRVNGTLAPPATSLVLRMADGREIAPIETDFVSLDRWKRINFAAPKESFQIVVHDRSPTSSLDFTGPVELSALSRAAGKIARPWLALTVLGAGVALLAVWFRGVRTTFTAPPVSTAWWLVPWFALLAYGVFFWHHIDPVAGPNDSGGYLNSAKALASGHLGPQPRPVFGRAGGETDLTPYLATTFHKYAGKNMAPEYPVGLPLVFAALGSVLTMERAVPIVILAQLLLGVFFTRQLARAVGLSGGWDWLAAGIIGMSPLYLFQGLQPQSDSPSLVWCTAAVYFAWTSRRQVWRALPAGLLTGLVVLIRPSNALVVIPVAIALFGAWRQFGLWLLAGLPAALWLAWYNHTLYGSALLTGYGDMSGGFGLRFVPLTLRSYAMWLPLLFTPLAALALAGPFLRTIDLRLRLMLAAWLGVFAAFYACYWCTWDHWYNMRFLLPAAPALVLLALFATRALATRAGLALFHVDNFWRGFAPTAVLVVALAVQLIADQCARPVLYWMHYNALNVAGPRWLAAHVPADAVVFAKHATNSLLFYTDLTFVRSDSPQARSEEFFSAIARAGRPIYALNYSWEGHGKVQGQQGDERGDGHPDLPGTWTKLTALADGEVNIWQWSAR